MEESRVGGDDRRRAGWGEMIGGEQGRTQNQHTV